MTSEHLPGQGGHLVVGEATESDHQSLLGRQAHQPHQLRTPGQWPHGADDRQSGAGVTGQTHHREHRRWVGPLEVVQGQQHRGLGGHPVDQPDDRVHQVEAQLGRSPAPLTRPRCTQQGPSQVGQVRILVVGSETERIGDAAEGAFPLQLVELCGPNTEPARPGDGSDLVQEPRLADAGLSFDEGDPREAEFGGSQQRSEGAHVLSPAEQGCWRCRHGADSSQLGPTKGSKFAPYKSVR
jgi:hypothetical protein